MKIRNNQGFTLIEILMGLILIAVLSAIAINSFVNFRTEARNAALAASLAALRSGIASQYAQMQLRCNTNPGVFPTITSLTANNIADGGSTCTTTMVTVASERSFVQGAIPVNPWSSPLVNTVTDCSGGNCILADTTFCGGTTTASEAWCYNPATGEIWADSATATREAM